jgi:protein ImuB
MPRILCAWSPDWAIANWRRRNATRPDSSPFALVETVRQVRRLAAVSREAATLGLFAGQKATDARARVPELVLAEAEPEADARALRELSDWCVRYSPAVAIDPPDGLFLDITGVAHLWGGETELRDDFVMRLRSAGLSFRLAIAETAGAAWAMARFGPDGAILSPGDEAAALQTLPPAALRLDPEAAAQIERLGLRRLGQIVGLPRAPFGRRFGAAALTRLDQALGRAPEVLSFRRPPTPWVDRLAVLEPVSTPDDMARVCADVIARLCTRLEAEARAARRFEVVFHRVDGKVPTLAVGLAIAGRDAARIAKLFAPRIETIDPGFGVEAVTGWAHEVEPLEARQRGMGDDLALAPEDGLAPLVDRLVNRLGAERVWRAAAVPSHIPERAAAPASPLAEVPATWDPEAPRPLRLFRRPEPLEGVFALLPDDPPRRFRWRGRTHEVSRAEGPERIAAEWWRHDIAEVSTDQIRDYYRVEDQDGARFWLFRAGLYGAGDAPPKWWLHGLFG